jgi:hypothetical protein
MMDERMHLRKVAMIALPGLMAWTIEQPAAVEGEADDELRNAWVELDDPPKMPTGTNLVAVPGVNLWLESGGSLSAVVEFGGPGTWLVGTGEPDDGTGFDGDYYLDTESMEWWGPKGDEEEESWEDTGPTALPDPGEGTWIISAGIPPDYEGEPGDYWFDRYNHKWWGPKGAESWDGTGPTALPDPDETVVISEANVGSLAAVLEGEEYSDYGLVSSLSVSATTAGTHTSDWIDIGPIPAGSGFVIGGGSSGGGASSQMFAIAYGTRPTGDDASGELTAYLDLGDEDENEVATVDLLRSTMMYTPNYRVLSGSRNPKATDGVNGDYWLNTNYMTCWGPKSGTSWPYIGYSFPPQPDSSVDKADVGTNNQALSWGSIITKCRLRMEVADATNCSCAVILADIGLRRFY